MSLMHLAEEVAHLKRGADAITHVLDLQRETISAASEMAAVTEMLLEVLAEKGMDMPEVAVTVEKYRARETHLNAVRDLYRRSRP